MKTTSAPPAGLEHKSAGGAGLLDVDKDEGVVTAIVSVTGVKDRVNDVILPGAYRGRPIGVWHHDEKVWASRTEDVRELQPGDPLLPSETADGQKWPAEAGGLWVQTRFNLETQAGREAFSNVKFFDKQTGWSIGYRVPAGGYVMKDGVRFIKELQVWEYSPVMVGAASEAMTLSVKSAMTDAVDVDVAHAEAPQQDQLDAARAEAGPVDVDRDLAAPADDEIAADLVADPATLVADPVAAMHAAAMDEIDWAEVDDADVADVGIKAEGGADKNRGNAEKLRRWYVAGADGQITWGSPGDFAQCVAVASKHLGERAKGYCNLRHQDATGAPPGKKLLLDTWSAAAETGPLAAHLPAPGEVDMESKSYPYMDGTVEAQLDAVRSAVNEALRGEPRPTADGQARWEWDWVNVDGTWPDRVVATRHRWDEAPEGRTRETFEVSYHVDMTGAVVLGTPVPVHLRTVVENGGGEAKDAMLPAEPLLTKAADGIKAMLASGEGKSGRVLSRTNAGRLSTAFTHLADVLRAAGVELEDRPAAVVEAKTESDLDGLPDPADYVRSLRLLV